MWCALSVVVKLRQFSDQTMLAKLRCIYVTKNTCVIPWSSLHPNATFYRVIITFKCNILQGGSEKNEHPTTLRFTHRIVIKCLQRCDSCVSQCAFMWHVAVQPEQTPVQAFPHCCLTRLLPLLLPSAREEHFAGGHVSASFSVYLRPMLRAMIYLKNKKMYSCKFPAMIYIPEKYK